MTIAVGSFTSAAGSAHPAIPRRRRPADSRPAACRIILISDSGADGAVSERVHISTTSALDGAINLPLYGAYVGVDVEDDRLGNRRSERNWLLLVGRQVRITERAIAPTIAKVNNE